MEKYISFSVSTKLKDEEEELVTYKLKFIDSKRFMNTSLLKLVDNMSGINKYKSEVEEFSKNIELLKKLSDGYSRTETDKYTKNIRSMINKPKTLNNDYLGNNNNLGSMINALSILNDEYSNLDSNFVKNIKSDIARLSQLFSEYLKIKEKILLLDLKEKFPNTCRLANDDINKFSLLLRKGIYPYDYMDCWKRFDEDTLPPKKRIL